MNLNENLALAMRAIMKARHMSLTEFAKELDVSRAALHDYIKARGNPSAATIEHIAQKLDVSPASLMTGLVDLDHQEIVLMLLDTLQGVAELPEDKRIQMAEHFLAMVKLWNEK